MKPIRIVGVLFLTLLLAVGLSACGKKAETDVSSTMPEEGQATADNPATTQEYTAPEPNTSQPTTTTTTTTTTGNPTSKTTKTTTKSTPAKTTKAVTAAETRTVSLPAGATFEVQMTTPVDMLHLTPASRSPAMTGSTMSSKERRFFRCRMGE